jgi:cold shock CspA family protein
VASAPDSGGKDVFVYISAVEKAGLDGLPDGAKVTFDIVPTRQGIGGKSAGEVSPPAAFCCRQCHPVDEWR